MGKHRPEVKRWARTCPICRQEFMSCRKTGRYCSRRCHISAYWKRRIEREGGKHTGRAMWAVASSEKRREEDGGWLPAMMVF